MFKSLCQLLPNVIYNFILTLKVDNYYLKYLYKMLDINFKCINSKGINHNA